METRAQSKLQLVDYLIARVIRIEGPAGTYCSPNTVFRLDLCVDNPEDDIIVIESYEYLIEFHQFTRVHFDYAGGRYIGDLHRDFGSLDDSDLRIRNVSSL